jgi:hypothetical protein
MTHRFTNISISRFQQQNPSAHLLPKTPSLLPFSPCYHLCSSAPDTASPVLGSAQEGENLHELVRIPVAVQDAPAEAPLRVSPRPSYPTRGVKCPVIRHISRIFKLERIGP